MESPPHLALHPHTNLGSDISIDFRLRTSTGNLFRQWHADLCYTIGVCLPFLPFSLVLSRNTRATAEV